MRAERAEGRAEKKLLRTRATQTARRRSWRKARPRPPRRGPQEGSSFPRLRTHLWAFSSRCWGADRGSFRVPPPLTPASQSPGGLTKPQVPGTRPRRFFYGSPASGKRSSSLLYVSQTHTSVGITSTLGENPGAQARPRPHRSVGKGGNACCFLSPCRRL